MRDAEDPTPDPEELALPEDLEPPDLAGSLEDELVAEEGVDLGLDPDLAVFAARDELALEDDEFVLGEDDLNR